MSTQMITSGETGTWIGGSHGWQANYMVVYLAESYGFHLDDEDQYAIAKYRFHRGLVSDELIEAITGQGGLVDKATEHMQSLAPAGHHFEWDAGELSLLPCSAIEGDSCDVE